MGKRKKSSRKPQGPKRREPLSTTFNCLFCNHEDAVTCKLDKKAGTGQLSCKICGQHFQSNINYLSHAVDVYSEWIDACDEIANPKPAKAPSSSQRRELQRGNHGQGQMNPRDEGDKGGVLDDGLSDLEDFDDDENNDEMQLGRSVGVRGMALEDGDDEDDDL